MRPLQMTHQGWEIRVSAHRVGRAWSALVEASPPGQPWTDAQVVPFNATLPSEKLAQLAGRAAAIRWVDREAKRA